MTGHYNIFIHHRRSHRELAGMVYMYCQQKGASPFWDVQSLGQGTYPEALSKAIIEAPYFLSVLSEDALSNMNPSDTHDIYYRELEEGLSSHKPEDTLLIATQNFRFPEDLPWRVRDLRDYQYYRIKDDLSDFFYVMDRLFKRDIDVSQLVDTSDWRVRIVSDTKTLVLPRKELESNFVTNSYQFGDELVKCAQEGRPFYGERRIKHINMACSAANMIFLPDSKDIDTATRDMGTLSRIYKLLLEDTDFSFNAITYAPFSAPTEDQIKTKKFGSSVLEYPQAAFLGTYANVCNLIKSDSIYKKARQDNRFFYYVTDSFMPFSVLQVEYKPKWREFNHIKIDLYSGGIANTSERRSMVFFEESDKANYDFFANHFQNLIDYARSQKLEWEKSKDRWLKQWESYQRGEPLS